MNELTSAVAVPATSPGEEAPAPRASVLLVDDQPARLLTYEAILSGLELHCVRAGSGKDALQRLLEEEFAVLILDVHMPEMDGFELARLIREHPRLERVPIIFVTGVHVSELDQLKGYEVGAIDYISVPVVPEILRSKVALLVELHLRRRELRMLNRELELTRQKLETEHAQAIADRDAQLEAVFEHPHELTIVLEAQKDEAGTVQDWVYRNANTNALELLGRSREQLIGRRLSDVLPEARVRSASEVCNQVLATRTPVRYESLFAERVFSITVFAAGPNTVISSGIDMTEQRRLQHALQESDRRKDEFLAMLAHELRNPIAPISNAAAVLSRVLSGNEQATSLVTMIQRQSSHVARLLDDLLDVARVTQGRIRLRLEKVDLKELLEHAVKTVQPLYLAKSHALTLELPTSPLLVEADTVRIEQCVVNLLTNAIKYTDPQGQIHVKCYPDGAHAIIEVTDNGVGIAPEFLPHVFGLFTQGEHSLDRANGGLGVGLSICKRLIDMHRGSITCISDGKGKGATFQVRLPLAGKASAETAVAPPSLTVAHRVLVVDDNRDAADSLAMFLELEGCETRATYSAEEALEHIVAFAPNTVLLDIGLPGMDGYEVAERIKATKLATRLIALTGYGQDEDKQRSERAGFDAHVLKPVDLDDLKVLILAPKRGR